MIVPRNAFLAQARVIANTNPIYRTGGDGSDGTCDCIGLVIGAIWRAGGSWSGLHGSNWAARNAVGYFRSVRNADSLHAGEIVFKSRAPGDAGYSLPERYAGGADKLDYYHVGIVLSVNPLDILHCTDASPAIRHDTKLGSWSYAAELNAVQYDVEEVEPMEGTAALYRAMVTTESDPLRVRESAKTGRIIGKIPRGATVDVLRDSGDGWPFVRFNELAGYASAEYLTRIVETETEPENVAENATTAVPPECPAPTVTIIDDEGNTFMPSGNWRVLINAVD